MPVLLGGETAWQVRRRGDLIVSFQWLDKEPALFIYPARRDSDRGAFVVPLELAHRWANADGYPNLEHAIPAATMAAAALGLGHDRLAIRRLVDAVLDSLPDLLRMPPQPPQTPVSPGAMLGELTIKADGKTVAEHEIRDTEDVES